MSILRYMRKGKIDRKTTLFFGTRTEEDLYCVEELKNLEKELSNFSYVPTLSRVSDDSLWTGERGRVTSLIEKHVQREASLDVYICGNAEMVESCLEAFKKKEVSEKYIYFDKFS
jgi:Na+-transporting NADH:ubiquinone oxidoreductase subunit F